MENEEFLPNADELGPRGKSRRAFEAEPGVDRGRVEWAQKFAKGSIRSAEAVTNAVFVGRQPEMGELVSALDDAKDGRGRLVVIAGEPGIGKTRTAQELAAAAEQQGAQVLWGRCYEGGGAPPFWPWAQSIRSYVRQAGPEELRCHMGAGAADIGQIVPEVGDKLPTSGHHHLWSPSRRDSGCSTPSPRS